MIGGAQRDERRGMGPSGRLTVSGGQRLGLCEGAIFFGGFLLFFRFGL
jgi:hypothetical protein